jgi:hypothetical protein
VSRPGLRPARLHPTTLDAEVHDCPCPMLTVVVTGAFPDAAVVSHVEHRPGCDGR